MNVSFAALSLLLFGVWSLLDTSCLHRSQDQLAVLIEITPRERTTSAIEIQAALSRSAFSDYLLDPEALTEAVDKFLQLNQDADLAKEWGQTFVKLASCKDAEVVIDVSEDMMIARATIIAAYGGSPIVQQGLVSAMREAGVSFGLQKIRATELLKLALQAEPGQSVKRVVAIGRKAVDGSDSHFERFVETPSERRLKPKQNADGTVDMRDLGGLETVEPGAQLMRRHPFVVGREGMNVCGEHLPHYTGREIPFTVGEGTTIATDDPDLLIAANTGLPLEIENGMKVDDVLNIKKVDAGYGHVDFAGSVLITGDVGEGMKVKATGDVHVNGFVESAHIDAGGDVTIGKGIIGHRVQEGSENYSCRIEAKGELNATFAQYSELRIDKGVTITSQMLHSKVVTDGKVAIQDSSGLRGTLVGGRILAGGEVSAVILGATAGTATQIEIEGNLKDIQSEKSALSSAKHEVHNRISKVLDAQMRLSSGKTNDEDVLKRLDTTLNHARQELAQIDFALDDSAKQEDAFFANAKLVVKKEMHPNVRLDIAGLKLFTNREYGPTESNFEEGKLLFEPYNPQRK